MRKPGVFHPGRDAARRAAMDLIRGGPFAPLGLPRGARVCARRGCSGANKKRRESQSFLSARAKTRSFSPGPRRRPPGGNGSHPRRALRPPRAPPRRTGLRTARLFRGKQEKERKPKLSLSPGENPEFFTRAETPPAGRQWISSEAGPSPPSGSPAAHGSAHGAAVPGQTRKGEKAKAFSPYTGSGQIT